jgi:hypothetical protein
MANSRQSVKFVDAALSLRIENELEHIVLRGVLSPDSLDLLQVGSYQREILSRSTIEDLREPVKAGRIPEIVLGVRGQTYTERDNAFYLSDPVFIIDGLQRVAAARLIRQTEAGSNPRLGCTVFFGTDPDFERRLFLDLNTTGLKLSPNVVLRDMAPDYAIISDIWMLTRSNHSFALYDRVCWDQRMSRGHLINGRMLARIAGLVHSKFGPTRGSDVKAIASGLQQVADQIGARQVIDNTITYFDLIDECFGLRRVQFKDAASQIKGNFLIALTRLMYSFPDFWEPPTRKDAMPGFRSRLVISRMWREKLRTFPLHEPEIMRLASAGGTAMLMLYTYILDHLNKGRRTRRLVDPSLTQLFEEAGEPEEEEAMAN